MDAEPPTRGPSAPTARAKATPSRFRYSPMYVTQRSQRLAQIATASPTAKPCRDPGFLSLISGSTINQASALPGHFFIVEETGDDVTLALGDISGKGLAAGMWITLLLGLVGTHSAANAEPQAIVAGVNRDLCRMSLGSPLASLFLARLDSARGTLDYCSAGHPPALLLRASGKLESLSEGGLLLGVVPEASFVSGSVELRVGDVLLVYSDGILEARNSAHQEFGFEQLEAHLRRARSGPAEAILFSVLGAVQDFAGACPQADDMSLVVVRRRAPRDDP